MQYFALPILILLFGCSGIQRDGSRHWAKSWGGAYCHSDDGSPYNCTQEEILEMAERSDYRRTSRELASTVNKNARSLPVYSLEREWMAYKIALRYMNKVQHALYAIEMNAASRQPGYAEKVMEGVPEARLKMNVFMRKILEIPASQRHRFSEFLVARITELNGDSYSNAVPIERGALLWEFSDDSELSASDNYYLLDDLREEADQIYVNKQGGGLAAAARTVCTGLLACAGGFSGKSETTLPEMKTRVGIRVIFKGRYGEVKGLKPI